MNYHYFPLYFIEFYFAFYLLFPFILLLLGFFLRREKIDFGNCEEIDIAAVITAYKETDILIPLTDSLLKQNYSNYLIYIVADECETDKLIFNSEKVIVLKPKSKIGSKVRSIEFAISNFKRNHTAISIFDADNLAHPDFLKYTNFYLSKGFKAVQGERRSKNYDTMFACLDSARDYYYNYYDGYLSYRLGSSATLAGSGMTFEVELYKQLLTGKQIVGGFDKILQSEIVKRKLRIAYSRDAVVYDEKVRKSEQLVKQRTRWINTWFKYFRFGFAILFKGLFTFSFNQFLFGVILLRPPIFIFILGALFFTGLNIFLDFYIFCIWAALFFLFFLSFVSAMLLQKANKNIWKSLMGIPVFIFFQITAMLHLKKANKKFLETEHEVLITIDDILKNEKSK